MEDPSRRTHPLAATLAVAVVQYSFHGGTVRGEKAPSPLYFFAHPARVYDMPLLESMLPSVPSRYQAHCRELIRRMRAEDARAVVPRRRSSACRPRLSTGEVFLHMSRNELAIVVGWQEKGEWRVALSSGVRVLTSLFVQNHRAEAMSSRQPSLCRSLVSSTSRWVTRSPPFSLLASLTSVCSWWVLSTHTRCL